MVVVGVLALVILAPIAYLVVLALYAHTRRVLYDLALQDLDRAQRRVNLTRSIYADDQGVYPLLWDGQLCLDTSRGVVFTLDGVQSLTPALVQPEQIARVLRAGGGWPQVSPLAASQPSVDQARVWPSRVPLTGLLDGPPSLQGLILGVTVDEGGKLQVIRENMARLVHIAVGGSSGWGKSVFLRALAYQLAQAVEKPALALVDLEGVTFAPFAQSERLLWPVADTESNALAVFSALADELDRRKELYTAYPGVDSLVAYNQANNDPLPAVVCLVDEATALLGDKSVEGAARTLALRGRKFGLWLVLGGQDWKAASLDTAIRNQLSSRVQFKAMSSSQSRVLLQQAGAEALDVQGRALAILPGRGLLELQVPFIGPDAIQAGIASSGPRRPMPSAPGDHQDDDLRERIRALAARGLSQRQIEQEVFGFTGGAAYQAVREVLGSS